MRDYLKKVVDTLLPGLPAEGDRPALPSASAVEVDRLLRDHLERHPQADELREVLDHIAAAAGGQATYTAAHESVRTAVLHQIETDFEPLFTILLDLVAADYYEHPAVMRAFGWRPGAPQPEGYPLN